MDRHDEPSEEPTTPSLLRTVQNAVGVGKSKTVHINETSMDRGFVLEHPMSQVGLYLVRKFAALRNDSIKIKIVGNSRISYKENMFNDDCVDHVKLTIVIYITFPRFKLDGNIQSIIWGTCTIDNGDNVKFEHARSENETLDVNVVVSNKTKRSYTGYQQIYAELSNISSNTLEFVDPNSFNSIYAQAKELETIKKLRIKTHEDITPNKSGDLKIFDVNEEIDLYPLAGKIFL